MNTCIQILQNVSMFSFHNVQILKPAMTGHLSCQAAFAAQRGQPVIAGLTYVNKVSVCVSLPEGLDRCMFIILIAKG